MAQGRTATPRLMTLAPRPGYDESRRPPCDQAVLRPPHCAAHAMGQPPTGVTRVRSHGGLHTTVPQIRTRLLAISTAQAKPPSRGDGRILRAVDWHLHPGI